MPALLTPHAGELARMLGVEREQVEAEQLRFAREAAQRYDAVVLLKGRHTLVATPDGEVRVTTVGPAWLATAGAGDVLAGLCGSLVAAGLDPFDAGSVGSWLHGAAAVVAGGGGPVTAPDVAAALPAAAAASLLGAGCGAMSLPDRWVRAPSSSSTSTRSRPTSRPSSERVGDAAMMTVVKADGYGHGLVESARAARAGGADWLGTAVVEEALALRAAGDTGRILTWLAVPGEDYTPPDRGRRRRHGVHRGAGRGDRRRRPAARRPGPGAAQGGHRPEPRRRHRTRTGRALVEAAADAEQVGAIQVVGVWSHFACSDEPDHPSNDAQEKAFVAALKVVDAVGIEPEVRHLSNSAGALLRPWSAYDLVRCGIASYGLSPAPDVRHRRRARAGSGDDGADPARDGQARARRRERLLRAHLDRGAGHAPRAGAGGVRRRGAPARLLGRARPGRGERSGRSPGGCAWTSSWWTSATTGSPRATRSVLFGDGRDGAPTAQDWAEACGTISYEIVTRIGGRFVRRHVSAKGLVD